MSTWFFQVADCVRALWQARVDRKPAPVPLPGSPEAPDAPPSGVEWMEHELKLGAGPESPTSSYFVEDVRPKVCLPESGRQWKILLWFLLGLLAL